MQGFWRLLRKGTSFTPTQVERFCSHYHFLCVRALLAKCATVVHENKDKETLLAICGAHVYTRIPDWVQGDFRVSQTDNS